MQNWKKSILFICLNETLNSKKIENSDISQKKKNYSLVWIWNPLNSIHISIDRFATQSLVSEQRIQLSCYLCSFVLLCSIPLHFHFTLVNLIFDVAISATRIEHESNAIHQMAKLKLSHDLHFFLWKYQYWINAITIWIPFNRQLFVHVPRWWLLQIFK